MRNSRFLAFATYLVFSVCLRPAVAEIVVDNFQTPFDVTGRPSYSGLSPSSLGTVSNVSSLTQPHPAGAIGDRRADFIAAPLNVPANLDIASDMLHMSADGSTERFAYAIYYTVDQLDLRDEVAFKFSVEGNLAATSPSRFGIALRSDGLENAESRGLDISSNDEYVIPFSWYQNVDFSNINQIVVASNAELPGAEFSIGKVSTVSLDCDGNGAIDVGDLSCMASYARNTTLDRVGLLAGDLDANGTVDFSDFLVVSNNFGKEVDNYTQGDVDLNGFVQFNDYLTLSANFGRSMASATAAAVPEPQAWLSMLVGLTLVSCFRRARIA